MVSKAQDGDHFVEIGTLLGQSTSYMGQLIKDSGKDIKFDSIDLFWPIEHVIRNYTKSNRTPKRIQSISF